MFEIAVQNNLPTGIVVNYCYIIHMTWKVSVILITTTRHNILIRHPLLAADVFKMELHLWKHSTVVARGWGTI